MRGVARSGQVTTDSFQVHFDNTVIRRQNDSGQDESALERPETVLTSKTSFRSAATDAAPSGEAADSSLRQGSARWLVESPLT